MIRFSVAYNPHLPFLFLRLLTIPIKILVAYLSFRRQVPSGNLTKEDNPQQKITIYHFLRLRKGKVVKYSW